MRLESTEEQLRFWRGIALELLLGGVALAMAVWWVATMWAMRAEQHQAAAEELVHIQYFGCSWLLDYYGRSQSEPSAYSLTGHDYEVVLGDVSYVGDVDGRPPRFVVNLKTKSVRAADAYTRQYLADHPCRPS